MQELPVLTATDVHKSFRRGSEAVHALAEVSVELRPGEFVALVGRSGSGKSTLLNVLAGWETPDSGSVTWHGLGGPSVEQLPWAAVAILPQSVGLIEELSIRANIELPARLARRLPAERERVDHLIDHFGLRDLAGRMPAESSLGEQQRAALARALALQPELLLIDEPTGHQDGEWARRVISALNVAAGEGTCCFVATHSAEVAGFASRVLRIEDGRIGAD